MIRGAKRPLWRCPKCLRQSSRHGSSVAATATRHVSPPPAAFDAPDSSHDDKTLRLIFDSPAFWRDFSQRRSRAVSEKSVGLFQNRYLTEPQGFNTFAQVSLRKCHRVVSRVRNASSVDEYRRIARDLDLLSDLICRVIDICNFVRSTHPDRKIQAAASGAYAMMYEYMNQLNTMPVLREQLKRARGMPEVFASWSDEEKAVVTILDNDFRKSAIDFPEEKRAKFVQLSNEIAEIGTAFVDEMAPEQNQIDFHSHRLKGMDPQSVKGITNWGISKIPTTGRMPQMVLNTVEDADVRSTMYIAQRTASKQTIAQLEKLLTSRAELAQLTGYPSFGHLTLEDKMAQTPEAVKQFLQALAADNKITVMDELEDLLEIKRSDAHNEGHPPSVMAWDRNYYAKRLTTGLRTHMGHPNMLSNYFSLGTVMQGLSRLFHRLYGVRLVPREPEPGETWNDDVRRLDVIDERSGRIAVVYCDLFARPGKTPNPAHFTLRCSRHIEDTEVAEFRGGSPSHPFRTAVEAVTDGMAHAVDPSNGLLYQLPTIALICDFARHANPSSKQPPALLAYSEVQTLFHEMGHAIHSILGRTQLQNVAGTRCATDFGELPSVLMEHFAFDPAVLGLWARNWETDAPLRYDAVKTWIQIDRRTQGAETEGDILFAMLDQAYYSVAPSRAGIDSTAVFHDVWDEYGNVPEPRETRPQGFFGHLYFYGATYYSYLFDRAIAGKVWKDVFQRTNDGAIDRRQGERFREEVLRWGGARDGWKCVAGVLGDEYAWMAEGGEDAMKEVGRWGVKR